MKVFFSPILPDGNYGQSERQADIADAEAYKIAEAHLDKDYVAERLGGIGYVYVQTPEGLYCFQQDEL